MSGQKHLATIFGHICYKNITKILKSKETDRTEQYASKEECIKWNRQSRYIHSKFQGLKEDQKESLSKLDDLQNLLIKLTVKVRAEKAWILYEFPFSLNPSDESNDAQTSRSYSSLYPVSTERKIDGTF